MTCSTRESQPRLRAERSRGLRLLANPDRKTLKRINQLIADVLCDPFAGIGKPEPLKHILTGAWSRRIGDADRLVYFVTDEHVVILQARDHY